MRSPQKSKPCISKTPARRAARPVQHALALLAVVLAAPLAHAAGAATEAVTRVAREHLLEEAERAGLSEPVVTLKVLRQSRDAADCSGPLEVEPIDTRHASRMRFAAICRAGEGWREELVVRGQLSAEVVVAAVAIDAGRPIAVAELALERRTVVSAEAASSDPGEVAGQASRRALRAGQPIDRRALVAPILVQRGAAVAIVATNGQIRVTTAGEALAPGRAGDVVEVRNTATGRVIRARVTASNVVEPAEMTPIVPPPHSAR